MYTLILIAVLSGSFGPTTDGNPIVVKMEFASEKTCLKSGDSILEDFKHMNMRVITARCIEGAK